MYIYTDNTHRCMYIHGDRERVRGSQRVREGERREGGAKVKRKRESERASERASQQVRSLLHVIAQRPIWLNYAAWLYHAVCLEPLTRGFHSMIWDVLFT